MEFKALDPIVPYHFHAGKPDDMLCDMIRLRREYGIRRFLITGPGAEVRLTGYPTDDVFRRIGETIREVREKTVAHDIEVGWWYAPTLTCGDSPYQHLVDIGGAEATMSGCPLDERFANDMARWVALVAEIARPFMIQLEDDYHLSEHPDGRVGMACFCPLHLKEFARRTGVEYSREELERIFTSEPMREPELRRQFALMVRDTMVDLSRQLRAAVDRVAPGTRMCLCEAGCTDFDGGLSESVPRALAGPNTRPAIRVCGTRYSSHDCAQTLPMVFWHAIWSAEHLPPDFELFHETDTYPHTRYFASAAFIKGLLYSAFAMGCDDTLFYGTQYLDDPLEETGYFDMLRTHRKKLDAFREAVQDGEMDGWQLVFRPDGSFSLPLKDHTDPAVSLESMGAMLACMGLPYTTRERSVKFLSGLVVASMSDAELLNILKSAVLIDSTAARLIAQRGFSDLLGVDIEKLDNLTFSQEHILPSAGVEHLKGRKIYNLAFIPWGFEHTPYVRLVPRGAEVLTEYCDPAGRSVQPGLTRFVNREGGRVAVMAGCMWHNRNSNMLSYRKKEILRVLYQWLNNGTPLPAAVLNAPNLWLLFNRCPDYGVILLNNLTSDPLPGPELALAPEYLNREIQELDMDGNWKTLRVEQRPASVMLPGECLPQEPRIIRISARQR